MSLKKILVIDDHPMMHRELEKVLKSYGFHFVGAFDAVSGLRMAKDEQPDLILLDIKLSQIDGKQVAKSLKSSSETKDIPIIFMTVTLSKKDDGVNQKIDVDGISYQAFAKPLNYLETIKYIQNVLSINQKENPSP